MTDDSTKGKVLDGMKLRQTITSHYARRSDPATVEMLAHVWAQMTIVQESLINIARIVGPGSNAQEKQEGFARLAENLEDSLKTISAQLTILSNEKQK